MDVTQRGKLAREDERRLAAAKAEAEAADAAWEKYRGVVVEMVEKSSYREVERLTGLSTNTLQRWKRAQT